MLLSPLAVFFQSQLKKQSAKAQAFYMDQVVHYKTILTTETIAYGDIFGARKLHEVCYIYSLLNGKQNKT
jgi:hypothetical protein